MAALRESPVGQRPLSEAISLLTETTSQAGIVTEFSVLGEPRPLSNQIEYALYRVAQEGLTNVRKHARASRVDVLLDYSQDDVVRLEIADNGVGTAVADGGFGLLGIRERVQPAQWRMRHPNGSRRRFQTHCQPFQSRAKLNPHFISAQNLRQ